MNPVQKRMRTLVIAAVLVTMTVLLARNFSLEPASYPKSIAKQLAQMDTLLESSTVGNGNGAYSADAALRLTFFCAYAQEQLAVPTPDIDLLRRLYQTGKDELATFRAAQNTHGFSPAQLQAYKAKQLPPTLEKSCGKLRVTASLPIQGLVVDQPVNLDVTADGIYTKAINRLLRSNGVVGFPLTFLQDGSFPGRVDVTVQTQAAFPQALYLYRYSRETNVLSYVSNISTTPDSAAFSVAAGGDWVLCDRAPPTAGEPTDKGQEGELRQLLQLLLEEKEQPSAPPGNTPNPPPGSSAAVPSPDSGQADSSTDSPDSDESNSFLPGGNTGSTGKSLSCTVEIRCDTLLDKLDTLEPGLHKYLPSDGEILGAVEVPFTEGESAFTVLKRVARSYDIQLEFRNDPLYSGAYVKGINHLYEYTAGPDSGWMYQINDWFPNYGCSQYLLEDGDRMVWSYTCDLGRDIGDQYYD